MDQGTPSNFYLTLCLYVSFYVLFFTATTPPVTIPIRIPTDQELHENRRAKSYSEQLDPFLAATRKAQSTATLKQVKGIAKARAKATFGSVRGYNSRLHSRNSSSSADTHSRPHSRQHSQHSRQHSRQKSNSFYTPNTVHNEHPLSFNFPGSYRQTISKGTNPLTRPSLANLDFQVLQHPQTREHLRLYHHNQNSQHPSYPYPSYQEVPLIDQSLHPQQYIPPQRPPKKFPKKNQARYYHFYPDAPLFRTKMTAPQPSNAELLAATSKVVPDPPKKPDGRNQTTISTEQQQQQQERRGSIGWADRRNEHSPAERIGTSQATPEQIQTQRPASGRYENQCRLEESVTPSTLLAHLRLLRLVQSLVIIDDEDLDFLFLIRSEERYLMYLDLLQQLQPPTNAVPLPPLDVALMWTVHMLAPFRYHEDLLRSYSPHLLGYAFPLERYIAAIDIEDPSTNHEAFTPSKQMWRQLYPEEAFDLDKMDTDRMFEIQCLWCGGTNVMDSSTYIKFRIDGMAIDCAGCGSQCSLETLSSKRLWDGIEAYRANPNILLAGSLLSPWTGTPDEGLAQKEHHHLFFHQRIQFALDQASASLNCTWANIGEAFRDLGPDQYYGVRPTTLARITSSYRGLIEDRLSMDLVAGALRQRDFQKAMMVTGGQAWCQPQVLQRSLERYEKFMVLARAESKHTRSQGGGGVAGLAMAAGGGNLGAGQPGRHALVPTLDIDLAWHTHMLSPEHYRQYQLTHYGRVLNHDDTVQATSTMTKQDFVRTAELWESLYQERYCSQQTWKHAFVLTPKKLCAGLCFPPYGVYLIWKNWKSKRKAKKLNKSKAGGEKSSSRDKKKKKKTKGGNDTSSTNGKDLTPNGQKVDSSNSGPENLGKSADVTVEGLGVQDIPLRQQPDIKGKGKIVNESGAAEASVAVPEVPLGPIGGDKKDGNPIRQQSARNLNPALGLDGRLSNWNEDAVRPDGQASCSSGACIMSPWNELQDLVPYIDVQPPQQRELRRERT